MFTSHPVAKRRYIAAVTTIFIASLSVGTGVEAATASAEPDGSELAYTNCMIHYREYHPGASTEEVLYDCCITIGGIWSSDDWKNGQCITQGDPGWPGRTKTPPN